MASGVNVAGVVFGSIFGALFVMTCIISAVKAVRDRKRIKERIAGKRRLKLEKSAYDNFAEIGTQDSEHPVSLPSISIEVELSQSPEKSEKVNTSLSKRSEKTTKSPVRLNVPRDDTRETILQWNYVPNHKATKNIIRRNSYDMAINRYTVLCSKDNDINGTNHNSHSVAYENSAFNCDNFMF